MAVLVEALSVIVRLEAVKERFDGGYKAFLRQVPSRQFCRDRDFARVGFLTPTDVEAYMFTLEAGGLVNRNGNETVDFAVVDQIIGPTCPAPWLEFGRIEIEGMKISACWPSGQSPKKLAVPEGWKYDGSMSAEPGFVPNDEIQDRMKFLRHENGIDVYLDFQTGKEMYVGRPNIEGETEKEIFARLESIFHEALNIEAMMEPLRTAHDEQGLAPLLKRLNDVLLPSVQFIAEGRGRQMAFAHFSVGLILRILHRQGEAERPFRKAYELNPGYINILLELVRCLDELGKHSEALPYAREAVKVAPDNAGAWGNLAMCLICCGEREEARKAIDHAIELDPNDRINRYILDNFERYFKKP